MMFYKDKILNLKLSRPTDILLKNISATSLYAPLFANESTLDKSDEALK